MTEGVVLKYGGTSVGSIEKIQNIAKRIQKRYQEGQQIVVVVSAMGKTTNHLVELAEAISKAPCPREMDVLLSTGEQQSIALLSMAIQTLGIQAVSLTGGQAGILTKGQHTKTSILEIGKEKIQKLLDQGNVVVVAGFQGINQEGDITTLGRGGSDTSAVALAAALSFPCEIYSDVSGIYSMDPNQNPRAKKRKEVSYEEMMELSSLGAKVLEVRSVLLASHYKVPLYLGHAHGEEEGTWIKEAEKVEVQGVTGLSMKEDILLNSLYPLDKREDISKIFDILAEKQINIDMIGEMEWGEQKHKLLFTLPLKQKDSFEEALKELKAIFPKLKREERENLVQLSLVGLGMRSQSGVAAKAFRILREHNISYQMVTTSEISITYAIEKEASKDAVNALAEAFSL